MIVIPNPASPCPVMMPSSVCVNPNCAPHAPRMSPRMENPIPAAISVKKLAQNRIVSFKLFIRDSPPKEGKPCRASRPGGEPGPPTYPHLVHQRYFLPQ